jgi:ABC-type multidrug transport system ATPase subunit
MLETPSRYVVKVKDRSSKKMVDKVVLAGLSGVIAPRRLTAIMGASGAGKTSFLNVLVRQQWVGGSCVVISMHPAVPPTPDQHMHTSTS